MERQLILSSRGLHIGEPIYGVTIEKDGRLAFENDVSIFRFDLEISDQDQETVENVIEVIQDLWDEPERCLEEIEKLCPSTNFSERERKRIIHFFNCFGQTVKSLQMEKHPNTF